MTALRLFLTSSILIIPAATLAQNATPPPAPSPPTPTSTSTPPPQTEVRQNGLPGQIKWTFNFDAGWGNFGFGNSLYQNPKEGVEENLSDQWFEGYAKPALSGVYNHGKGEFYGKLSAVGERTYGSVPPVAGVDISSFHFEDASFGWRSGTTFTALGENGVDFVFGRAPFRLGKGFLLYDGAGEGGSRGGYWTNARKAFELAAIARFKPGNHTGEFFYLDKDELPEGDSGSRLWGANYEYSFNESSSFGVTYLKTFADPLIRPTRDGMNVFDVRGFFAPIPEHAGLTFEVEYAKEQNGDLLDSNGWYVQGGYQVGTVKWVPKFSYRYAFFQGDDVATPKSEAFDALFLGFNDWGAWWQGEIAGEYFLSNSNLISHQVRMHLAPSEAIGTGVIYFNFTLDQPASYFPGLTDKNVANEIDWYMDWKINKNFSASFVGAWADPGSGVQQVSGRTKNFIFGMAYVSYSY